MDPPFVKGKIAPFYQLDEYAFQSLCCDILGAEPKVATCAVYGKRGQAQFGVDLLAHRDGHDGIDVAQCKCYEQFSPGLVAAASDDFLNHWKEHWEERGVRRFILITACDIEDRKTVDAITDVSITLGNPDGSQSVYGFGKDVNQHENPIVDFVLNQHRGGTTTTGTVTISVT